MSCLHSAHGSRLPSWPLLPRWPPDQAWWHGSVYITRPLWSNAGDCWSVTVGWSNAGLPSVTWPPLRRSCPRYSTCTRGTATFTTCGRSCTSSMAMYTICGTLGHVHFMWYTWPCILCVVRLAMYTLCGMLGRVYFMWYAWPCILYLVHLVVYIVSGMDCTTGTATYTICGTHLCPRWSVVRSCS